MSDQSHRKEVRQKIGEDIRRCVGKTECRDVDALRVRDACVPCCSDGIALKDVNKHIGSCGSRADRHDDECKSAKEPVAEPDV